ncbi:hypothetical protein ACP275_14G081700 [Erythranthe tilingii]
MNWILCPLILLLDNILGEAPTLSARLPRIESRSTNYKYASSRLAITDKLEQLLADFSITAAVRYRLRNNGHFDLLEELGDEIEQQSHSG